MIKISFYIVRRLFKRYLEVNQGDFVIKTPENKFYLLDNYNEVTKVLTVKGHALDGTRISTGYVRNNEVSEIIFNN